MALRAMTEKDPPRVRTFLLRAEACRERLLVRITARDIHDFRTNLRRLEAALRLEKKLLGKLRYKAEIEKIKYLRDLTGPFREAEVTAGILLSVGLSPAKRDFALLTPGSRKAGAFQTILADKSFDLFFEELDRTLRKIEKEEKKKKNKRKIRGSFNKELDRIRLALQVFSQKGPKMKVMHQLRIRSKRLRYDLEQFEFLHPAQKKKLLKAAHRVHDALGQLRDLQAAEQNVKGETSKVLSALEERRLRFSVKAIQRLEKAVR